MHGGGPGSAAAALEHLLRNAPRQPGCLPENALLAIGVLTLPVPPRSAASRNFHRATHRAQKAFSSGRVYMRYVLTAGEVQRAHAIAPGGCNTRLEEEEVKKATEVD